MPSIHAYASNIISPYHRAGVLSFIGYYTARGTKLNAEIYTSNANWNKRILDDEILNEQTFTARFTRRSLAFGLTDMCKAIFALLFMRDREAPDILIIGHSRVNLKLLADLFASRKLTIGKKIATVVMDEGIGSYAGFGYRYRAFCRENQPGILHKLLYCIVYPFNQYFLKLPTLIDYDWRVLRFNKSRIPTIVDTPVQAYRTFFRAQNSDLSGTTIAPDILFIAQPLAELGLVPEGEYRQLLVQLLALANERNLTIKVKCHPAEDHKIYAELGYDLIDSNAAVESLIPVLRPRLLLGIVSTALINSRIFFDITSYSILELLPADNKLESVVLADATIKRIFTGFVVFVRSWPAMEEKLDQLRVSREQDSCTQPVA